VRRLNVRVPDSEYFRLDMKLQRVILPINTQKKKAAAGVSPQQSYSKE